LIISSLAGCGDSQEVQLPNDVLTSLSALPGVRSATLTRYSILSNVREKGLVVSSRGMAPRPDATYVRGAVGPSFFHTLQIPFLLGGTLLFATLRLHHR
jgi:hypothetical protein